MHCLKGVQIQSFSGLCFLAFRLNTEIYCQCEYGKIWTRKTLNLDIFNAVVSETLNLSGSTICPSIYCMFILTGQYTRSPMVDHFHQVLFIIFWTLSYAWLLYQGLSSCSFRLRASSEGLLYVQFMSWVQGVGSPCCCTNYSYSQNLFSFLESVQIWSDFWSVFSRIHSECGKMRTRNPSVFGHFSLSDSLKH